ncbi:protease modulator HflC [Roseomonas sp. NAR14]|uniref:Protein HflC n=1 Tax=Roseomonas acroporae TaxID=2937791 RepID=A0A9X1YC78_9PROT|nr:protease modulator HflC [Roseomonas acroporae]MCK8786503.1 protease modulator HflC [Roseomonas acroporae]
MTRSLGLLVALAVIVLVAASSLFTVNQTQQVLVTQFGQPIRVIQEPGLAAKVPFIQSVTTFDRRLLDFEAPGEEVILGDQRRLIVDSFARFRITNPLQYYQTVGANEAGIRARLSSIMSSALRRVLGGETLIAVLSTDRLRIMNEIQRQVNEEAQRFGIEVVDVRIRRADLPEENTQAILSRMQSERERVAREQRAEGAEVAARVRASADRERTVILAEGQAQADVLRGQGEQDAIRIFASAFSKDPAFFQFWRTMQAYRTAFSEGETRMVLTPDSALFRYFREAPAVRSNPAAAPVPSPPRVPEPPLEPRAPPVPGVIPPLGAPPSGAAPGTPSPAAQPPAPAPAATPQ